MIRMIFSNSGWWLLLLIPAVILTFIPYFRISKKYRRTRNRIISLTLHLTALTLAIFALAGLRFVYEEDNDENEVILLVDVSDTGKEEAESRDACIQAILEEGSYDGFRIGVVTFGFTQEYAVPLTYEIDSIYELYLNAALPDTSATDIAAALNYTKTLFEHPATSKIVLISDGRETDESALEIIQTVAAQGTRIDTIHIASAYTQPDVQVTQVTYPETSIKVDEEFPLGISLWSTAEEEGVVVEIYEKSELIGVQTLNTVIGENRLSVDCSFSEDGLHELRVCVSGAEDSLENNNEYYSYYYLQRFKNVLVLESRDQSSDILSLLSEEDYEVTVKNISEIEVPEEANDTKDPESAEKALQTVIDELREYDQIILNNIADSDLPAGFDKALYSYVYDYGGGLFTAGGRDEDDNAHAYNRTDLYGTLLQEMLPVEAIEYTPPVGVMIIIDISGSMSSGSQEGMSYLWWAKQGAISCLEALTERDYVGVMTLDTTYGVVLPLTSVTQKLTIQRAIESIDGSGATNYTNALSRAGAALVSESRVSKRHIILVTDGAPGDEEEDYLSVVDRYYRNNGITVSAVGIGGGSAKLKNITDTGHGTLHIVEDLTKLQEEMREDLNAPAIKDLYQEPFNPIIADVLSPLLDGVSYGVDGSSRRVMTIELKGFYGVKLKQGTGGTAELVLMGDYEVPIYAQWSFGKGMVGSFMCDLTGDWSNEFMTDENGKRFLLNVVENLMPVEDISPKNIRIDTFTEDNYINKFNIITDLEEGEYLEGMIVRMNSSTETENVVSLNSVTESVERDTAIYVTEALTSENHYNRCSFVAKTGGIYKIVILKHDAEGNILDTLEFYKEFSYSEEYDTSIETEAIELELFMGTLASRGNGTMIEDPEIPWEVFADFVTVLDVEMDPTLAMIIIAMVLFLLDIAVRKFKFKWPHELIREYRRKKAEEGRKETGNAMFRGI